MDSEFKFPEIENIICAIPDGMSALTKQFILEKNFDKRQAIRTRMKALLDFVSTDNAYPEIPGPSPAGGMQLQGQGPYVVGGGGANIIGPVRPFAEPVPRPRPAGVLPVPGAAEPIQEGVNPQ